MQKFDNYSFDKVKPVLSLRKSFFCNKKHFRLRFKQIFAHLNKNLYRRTVRYYLANERSLLFKVKTFSELSRNACNI